ncbi:MAG: aldo/keto reductase [Bacteriovoracaceae bacterium]|nr:aldo/keto reductase [Bacteriovoracaceae bacterium]
MTDILRTISPVRIAFGGAAVSGEFGGYGFGDISESSATHLLEYAHERGVRIFDTAPVYGFSSSEKRIGKAFKHKRDKVFIVSKCGVSWHSSKRINMTNDPKVCRSMLEQSLKDLQSDYIDLYMIHWPDKNVDIRFTMEVLARAKNEQKIKHIGLCNTNSDDLVKAQEVEKIEVIQSEFNLFNRSVKDELFSEIKKSKMSFMSWGTFDKGILTGRAVKDRKYDESDCRGWAPWWKKSNLDEKFEKYKKLKPLLGRYGLSGVQLALAHNLSHDEVSVAICGTGSMEQLDQVINAMENPPGEGVIKEAVKIIEDE